MVVLVAKVSSVVVVVVEVVVGTTGNSCDSLMKLTETKTNMTASQQAVVEAVVVGIAVVVAVAVDRHQYKWWLSSDMVF